MKYHTGALTNMAFAQIGRGQFLKGCKINMLSIFLFLVCLTETVILLSHLLSGLSYGDPESTLYHLSAYLDSCTSLQVFIYIDKIPISLLSAKQSLTLSVFSHRTDSPVPSSSSWLFAGPSPVCPCLSCTKEPNTGHSTAGVDTPVLSRRGKDHLPETAGNTPSNAAQDPVSIFYSRAYWWFMFNLVPTRNPRSFYAKLPSNQSTPSKWDCSSLGSRPGISLCWPPWGSCQPISSAFWGLSE